MAIHRVGNSAGRGQLVLVRSNLVFFVVLAAMYGYSNHLSLKSLSTSFGHELLSTPRDAAGLTPQERCVLNYPLSRQTECLAAIPGMQTFPLDKLAIHRLAIYAQQTPGLAIPENGSYSPVFVETDSAWQNIHIGRLLLHGISEEAIFNILPHEQQLVLKTAQQSISNIIIKNAPEATTFIEDHLKKVTRVWYIQTSRNYGAGGSTPFLEVIDKLNFVPFTRKTLQGSELLITGYETTGHSALPVQDYRYGSGLWLKHWKFDEDVNVRPCQQIHLKSWWSISESINESYKVWLELAQADNGVGISSANVTPAGIGLKHWRINGLYFDESAIKIPCEVKPGAYVLLVSVRQSDGNTRLPITSVDGKDIGTFLYITTLNVTR
jgi:hypothetical protein